MPYRSKAQQRYLHVAAARGDVDPKVVAEYDEATKRRPGGFRALPERVGRKKRGKKMRHKTAGERGQERGRERREKKRRRMERAHAADREMARVPLSALAAMGAVGGAGSGGVVGGLLAGKRGLLWGGGLGALLGARGGFERGLSYRRGYAGRYGKTAGDARQWEKGAAQGAPVAPRDLQDASLLAHLPQVTLEKWAETLGDLRSAFYPHDESLRVRENPDQGSDLPDFTEASRALAQETVFGCLPLLFGHFRGAAREADTAARGRFQGWPGGRTRSVLLQSVRA